MSGRVDGTIVVHTKGFGFLQLDAEVEGVKSAFIAPPDLNPFLAGDRVSAVLRRGRKQRWSAHELELVARERASLFGEVVLHRGKPHLKVDRMVANTDWAMDGGEPLEPGTLVTGRIDGSRVVAPKPVSEAEASLERVVTRHGIHTDFPEAVENTATAMRASAATGRRDLRDLTTITIDAPSSRDLDDALSVLPAGPDGALRVLVSIADVDALVPEGSPVDREARERGTSVYLAGRVLPMLPRRLSEDALSLLPEAERPAMTAELRLDGEGEVTSVDLYRSLIRSDRRLSYDEVAAFLDHNDAGELPEDVRHTLRWLRTAAARISAVRNARGGVKLLREEAYVRFDAETGEPTSIVGRSNTTAHELVERLMVAANEAVARWLVARGLPGAFRVHDAPGPSQLERLAESIRHLGFEAGLTDRLSARGLAALELQFRGSDAAYAMDTVLGQALGPARYTVHPSQHFGLAAPLYLHFTSPIRRYADLVVHRVIKAYLAGERERDPKDEAVETLCQHLNARARRATKAEQERLRMIAARHFAGRVGEVFDGAIVAAKPFGLLIQLRGTGVAGSVQSDLLPGGPFELGPASHRLLGAERTYTVGERLAVRVLSTDDALGRINLELATSNDG